jgi:hypothetical protein
MIEAARRLVGARYAALGVPDGDGGFAQVNGTSVRLALRVAG